MKQIQIVNTKNNEARTFDNQADADAYISEHAVGNFVATKTYQAKVFGVKRINYTIAFSEVAANMEAQRSFNIAVTAEEPVMFAFFRDAVKKRTKTDLISIGATFGADDLSMKEKKDVLISKVAHAVTAVQSQHIRDTTKVDHTNLSLAIAHLRDMNSWRVIE